MRVFKGVGGSRKSLRYVWSRAAPHHWRKWDMTTGTWSDTWQGRLSPVIFRAHATAGPA